MLAAAAFEQGVCWMAALLDAFGMCCGIESDPNVGGALALQRRNLEVLSLGERGLVTPGPRVKREGGRSGKPKVQCLIAHVGVQGCLRCPLALATDLALARGEPRGVLRVVGLWDGLLASAELRVFESVTRSLL